MRNKDMKQEEDGQQGEKKDLAILAVSFGTVHTETREKTIGAVESELQSAYPEAEIRRVFTSQEVIERLKKQEGLWIPNLEEALSKAAADGIRRIAVQPTCLTKGAEYTALSAQLEVWKKTFAQVVLGEPLLSSGADIEAVGCALVSEMSSYEDGETAICYVGHGIGTEANEVYQRLQDRLTSSGLENHYVGTVKAEPSLGTVLHAVAAKGIYRNVVLKPLMVTAGTHAAKDMAGGGPDSWKSRFASAGFRVTCLLQGLGENKEIRKLYAAHVKAALDGRIKQKVSS